MEKMKACPHCGGEAELVTDEYYTIVKCNKCSCGTGCFAGTGEKSKIAAVKAWNLRREESSVVDKNAEKAPTETFYLFLFSDDSAYEMRCAVSFKDAMWEMTKYTGTGDKLFFKCLHGFQSDDVEGIVELFNRFAPKRIETVYAVNNIVYDEPSGCKEVVEDGKEI